MDYLVGLHSGLSKHFRPQDTYIGNLLGALEALDSGITTLVDWSHNLFTPEHADAAIAALEGRGSPSHDGLAARLAGFDGSQDGLTLELQPMRWSLRLVREDASASLAALCVVRDSDGRWLAGRRAPWVATWAGRWALGAGGSVEVGEDPTETLTRELAEEWSVEPERETVEALVCLPNRMVMLVGQAWLPPGAEVRRDAEHDEHAWWPREVDDWPPEAHPSLCTMARLLGA
jgi:ADP-ribose pyrophosphatase YjhB (NUDIX family)